MFRQKFWKQKIIQYHLVTASIKTNNINNHKKEFKNAFCTILCRNFRDFSQIKKRQQNFTFKKPNKNGVKNA
jgi:hypothetical protein